MVEAGDAQADTERKLSIAVYAGTFDPLHLGHRDVAQRAARLFDRLIFAVFTGTGSKKPVFTGAERVELAKSALGDIPNLVVEGYRELTVGYAHRMGANALVKGVRTVADFEFELQQAHMNRALVPDIESVFLMTSPQYVFYSSSLIKEVALAGGDVSAMVPAEVGLALRQRRENRG
ncbi:MAG TPA: pantetheine-phosphate adenylyltransferase [Thermomicrobiales bacterium]|jgi:pantetheine-phosphate adenylyltransferase